MIINQYGVLAMKDKSLTEIYHELIKGYDRRFIYQNDSDFIDYCYAYRDGECKKFSSKEEALKFSKIIECFYDEKKYQEELKKQTQHNKSIITTAEQKIKEIIKEKLGLSNNKLDSALFELAFELGEREFNNDCELHDSCHYNDKDRLFCLVDLYYDYIKTYLPKEKLVLKD